MCNLLHFFFLSANAFLLSSFTFQGITHFFCIGLLVLIPTLSEYYLSMNFRLKIMLCIFLLVPSQNLVIASRKTSRINPSKVCVKDPVWFTETKACLGILAKRGISVNTAARVLYTHAATLPLITVPPTMTWTCNILFPRLYSDANTHLETKLLQGWSLKAKLPFYFLLLQYTYYIFTILFIILPFPLHLSLSLRLSPPACITQHWMLLSPCHGDHQGFSRSVAPVARRAWHSSQGLPLIHTSLQLWEDRWHFCNCCCN